MSFLWNLLKGKASPNCVILFFSWGEVPKVGPGFSEFCVEVLFEH